MQGMLKRCEDKAHEKGAWLILPGSFGFVPERICQKHAGVIPYISEVYLNEKIDHKCRRFRLA